MAKMGVWPHCSCRRAGCADAGAPRCGRSRTRVDEHREAPQVPMRLRCHPGAQQEQNPPRCRGRWGQGSNARLPEPMTGRGCHPAGFVTSGGGSCDLRVAAEFGSGLEPPAPCLHSKQLVNVQRSRGRGTRTVLTANPCPAEAPEPVLGVSRLFRVPSTDREMQRPPCRQLLVALCRGEAAPVWFWGVAAPLCDFLPDFGSAGTLARRTAPDPKTLSSSAAPNPAVPAQPAVR